MRLLFEERIGKDAENVMAVVVPILVYKLKSNLLQLIDKTLLAGNIIALLQGCGYCVLIRVFALPVANWYLQLELSLSSFRRIVAYPLHGSSYRNVPVGLNIQFSRISVETPFVAGSLH